MLIISVLRSNKLNKWLAFVSYLHPEYIANFLGVHLCTTRTFQNHIRYNKPFNASVDPVFLV